MTYSIRTMPFLMLCAVLITILVVGNKPRPAAKPNARPEPVKQKPLTGAFSRTPRADQTKLHRDIADMDADILEILQSSAASDFAEASKKRNSAKNGQKVEFINVRPQ